MEISIIEYDATFVQEHKLDSVQQGLDFPRTRAVTWLNIDGLDEPEASAAIARYFPMPPYILEEVLTDLPERPRVRQLDGFLLVVCNMLSFDPIEDKIGAEQLNLIVGHDMLLSFGKKEGDIFGPVRRHIEDNRNHIRKTKSDYLLYSLLDVVIDNYFIILEQIGEKTEYLGDQIIAEPSTEALEALRDLRRDMLLLRKSVWPLREVIGSLEREGSPLISKATQSHFRNLYEHTIQVIETTETLRDILTETFDIYLTSVSNRTNEIMRVLTIIATIFIPLTFIAGVYGMNFANMPGLNWRWGYPLVWGIMAGLAVLMLLYFRKKKWF